MARYNKIDLGPAIENCPQTKEALAAAATAPGTICLGTGAIATGASTDQGVALYIADTAWCSGGDTDEDNPIGDTMIMQKPLPRKIYAALLADGQNMTTSDFALKVAANGELTAATVGTDFVSFYGNEIYDNSAGGAAVLVQVRSAY